MRALVLFAAACLTIGAPGAAHAQQGTGASSRASGDVEEEEDGETDLSFVLNDSIVKLAPGAANGGDTMLLTVKGDQERLGGTLRVSDSGYPTAPTFSAKFVVSPFERGEGQETWIIAVNVVQSEFQGQQTRYVNLSYDERPLAQSGQREAAPARPTLAYSIDNSFPTAFTWRLEPPPASGLAWVGSVPITVSVTGSMPATNVRVVGSSLIDADNLASFAGGILHLCRTDRPCEERGVDLIPGSMTRLYLVPPKGKSVDPGSYTGNVVIAATQATGGERVALTVHHSSIWYRLAGAAVIALGVLLGWLLTVYLRHALARRQLQLAAAELRKRFEILLVRLRKHTGLPQEAAATEAEIKEALLELDETKLISTGAIPRRVPLPWRDAAPVLREFGTVAREANAKATGLTAIVDNLEAALALDSKGLGEAAIKTAVKTIDVLAPHAATMAVGDIAREARAAVNLAAANLGQQGDFGSSASAMKTLEYQVTMLSGAAWVLILSLTILTGFVALVVPNHGFGDWRDYLTCFLWGLGLSTAGAQAQALTAGSVSQSFNVSKPA